MTIKKIEKTFGSIENLSERQALQAIVLLLLELIKKGK